MTLAVTPGKAAAPTAASAATRANTSRSEAAPDGNAFLLALGACSAEADIAPIDQAVADTSSARLTASATDALPLATPADPPVPTVPLPAEPALPVVDAAALLVQGAFSAMAPPPPSVPTALPPPVVNSASATASVPTAAITATAATPAAPSVGAIAQPVPAGPAPAAPAPKGAGDEPAKPASAATAAATTTQLPPDEPAELAVPSRGVAHAGNGTASASYTNPALTVSRAQAQAQAQLSQAAVAPSDTRALAHIATAVAEPAVQAAFASSAAAPRRSERTDERSSSMFSSASGVNTHLAFAPGGSALMPAIDAASAGAASGHAGLTERLVEQVSWWLSQRTQGAELTLDVPGGSPVSVSIQVRGNEAQVAFRSDQPEARQMLANAMPQLKEMLGAEGLLLSGSSVGTSASGGRQGDAPPATPPRSGQISVDAAPTLAAPVRPLASGRTLDLYV